MRRASAWTAIASLLFFSPLVYFGELGVWFFAEPVSHLEWDEGGRAPMQAGAGGSGGSGAAAGPAAEPAAGGSAGSGGGEAASTPGGSGGSGGGRAGAPQATRAGSGGAASGPNAAANHSWGSGGSGVGAAGSSGSGAGALGSGPTAYSRGGSGSPDLSLGFAGFLSSFAVFGAGMWWWGYYMSAFWAAWAHAMAAMFLMWIYTLLYLVLIVWLWTVFGIIGGLLAGLSLWGLVYLYQDGKLRMGQGGAPQAPPEKPSR